MSMISGLIDRLRERAKELRNLAPDPDVPYLVPSTKETMALAMRSAASEMEDAADTIWQLRDDLQRANAAVQDAEHDESMAWDRVRKAEAENAKLQNDADLLREMLQAKRQETHALMAENAKLREQMERLVTLLRVDCDIEASWDGLRKFWSIELTEGGCLLRDRVCMGEAENAKMRELVEDMLSCIEIRAAFGRPPTDEMYETFAQRARELGIEVDE